MKLLYYALGCGILLWCTQLFIPVPLHAQSVADAPQLVFFDDFSHGSLEKWQDVRQSLGTDWRVVDGWAFGTVTPEYTLTELIPRDEFWNPSWHDIRYELDYAAQAGIDQNISWNFQTIDSWYELHIVSGKWELTRRRSGEIIWLVAGFDDVSLLTSYHIVIQVDGPVVEIWLDDQRLIQETDPTFDQTFGKIGLKVGTGLVYPTQARFDNVAVWLLHPSSPTSPSSSPQPSVQPSPTPTPSPSPSATPPPSASPTASALPIAALSQTNPLWGAHEYDHALRWAQPANATIGQWGCALTSLAMIFHYHGLTELPDGTALTPDSLNSWLRNQPDGYIGTGLLNWPAAMRLAQAISIQKNTTALEYSRVTANKDSALTPEKLRALQLKPARSQITSSRPVILQIPGHFLVGNGLLYNGNTLLESDLYITDPAYAYTRFTQHNQSLQSTLLFEPSHTDLSYLVALGPSSSSLTLRQLGADGAFHDLPQATITQETPQSLDGAVPDGAVPVSFTLLEYAKPETGTYQLTITGPPFIPQTITILAYDLHAAASDLAQTITPGANPATLTIRYEKEHVSTLLTSHYSPDSLENDIALLQQHPNASKRYALRTIAHLAQLSRAHLNDNQHQATAALLRDQLEWYKQALNHVHYQYLLDHFSLLGMI